MLDGCRVHFISSHHMGELVDPGFAIHGFDNGFCAAFIDDLRYFKMRLGEGCDLGADG